MCNCTPDSNCKTKTLVVNGTQVCSGSEQVLRELAESVRASEPEWEFKIVTRCKCSWSEEIL